MLYPVKLFLGLFLACQLALCSSALAQSEDVEAAMESVRASIESLAESSRSEAEKQELQEIYQNTLGFLQQSRERESEQSALNHEVEQAPAQVRTARQQLEAIKPLNVERLRDDFIAQDLPALEKLLDEKVARMFSWQNELTAINSELIAAQTRPERTQASVTANQTREQALSEQVRQLQRQPDNPLNRARIGMLRAEQQSLQLANDLLRQKLSANSVLQELSSQKRTLLSQQISDIEIEIQALQDVINDKRRSQSEQTVSDATEQVLRASNHALLREQGTFNRQLSEELLRATNQVGELTRKNIQTKQQIDSLTQIQSALEQQIGVLEGSLLLSRILHQQKQALPRVRLDTTVAEQIADLRLRQFELNQLRDDMANPQAYLDRLINKLPDEQRTLLRGDLTEVVDSRNNLVEQLGNNINTLLSQAITLQINQRQLQQLSSELQRIIDDQLFWVASNRPLDRIWLQGVPAQVSAQWQALQPAAPLKALIDALENNLLWLALLGTLMVLYSWARPALRQQLRGVHEDVGHFRRDSIRHTPIALLLTALMVLPVPVLLTSAGLLLSKGEEPPMPAIGHALVQVSMAWFILHLLYRIFDTQGVAARHFRWGARLVERLHRLTRRLAWIMLPLVLIIALGEIRPEQLGDDVIGRVLMILALLMLSFLLCRMMLRSEPLYHSRVLHFSATLLLTLAPLILAGMTALGYYYTSIKLADRFINTLYLIVVWMLLEGTVVRNLNVAGRRLAYQRALSKRESQQERDSQDGDITTIDVPDMNIQQINQQSLRLAKLGLLVLFGVLIYLTWSDLLSAASYLESVTLWEYNSGSSDNPLMLPISAADVLGALVIVVLTVTLARNLPGLLEILVLSRINLRQGSSYAITTLLSYTIISIGIIASLSTLGVSWNKLQWLVAALGVGLGFGLQEIFANFVSGLIILFERPVRIGDVVTIGPLSGTVNRIRIRATTITDFDHKEIIVPNKTFVTEQLINWSLSDTVTRVTLKLGLAHGSDLEKARQLLLQIADDNARVLKDPAPLVLFLNFGDGMLDHELRIHVRELRDRNMAIDEINREIARQFREQGIDIAFRQLDVTLHTGNSLEQLVERRQFGPGV